MLPDLRDLVRQLGRGGGRVAKTMPHETQRITGRSIQQRLAAAGCTFQVGGRMQ